MLFNPENKTVWVRQFGDNHKVKLGKNRSKTNGVKLSKMASGLWVSINTLLCSVSRNSMRNHHCNLPLFDRFSLGDRV